MSDEACPHCHRRYEGGKVRVEFMRCDCPGRSVGGGHLAHWCLRCGWYSAPGHDPAGWYLEPGWRRVTD